MTQLTLGEKAQHCPRVPHFRGPPVVVFFPRGQKVCWASGLCLPGTHFILFSTTFKVPETLIFLPKLLSFQGFHKAYLLPKLTLVEKVSKGQLFARLWKNLLRHVG